MTDYLYGKLDSYDHLTHIIFYKHPLFFSLCDIKGNLIFSSDWKVLTPLDVVEGKVTCKKCLDIRSTRTASIQGVFAGFLSGDDYDEDEEEVTISGLG